MKNKKCLQSKKYQRQYIENYIKKTKSLAYLHARPPYR